MDAEYQSGAGEEHIHVPSAKDATILTTEAVASRPADNGLLAPKDTGDGDRQVFPKDDWRRLSLSPAPSIRLSSDPNGQPVPLLPPEQLEHAEPSTLRRFWARNKPAMLVALSQLFGALMNLSARFLELEGDGMHPVQVLLMRQSTTSLACLIYMSWVKTPDFPFGKKELRPLLVLRGVAGYCGIYGMWYSMMYLPLADATVITFLVPGIAGILCYLVLREPFTRVEQLATLVALLGVVLIARPTTFFDSSSPDSTADSSNEASEEGSASDNGDLATPQQRLVAVGVAMLGVLGGAVAFTTLRSIGRRADPLISMNFFAMASTVIAILTLVAAPLFDLDQPALAWRSPQTQKQWLLLLALGIFGFIMQYLLTAGLSSDRSNRASSMVYTHMIFAAAFDRWVLGHEMDLVSLAGCTLIMGSAVGVVMTKRTPPSKTDDIERQGNAVGDAEGSPMLMAVGGNADQIHLERLR